MTHTDYINKDRHAAHALEILGRKRDGFVKFACGKLAEGFSSGEARESLVRKVRSEMEDALFSHLKRTGAVRGSYKYQYCYGFCRHVRREPRKSEVPSDLLDIRVILPDFNERLDAMMVEAGKLRMVSAIEAINKEANA
jgi:hypothetical protein